jgi:hypothetical protein
MTSKARCRALTQQIIETTNNARIAGTDEAKIMANILEKQPLSDDDVDDIQVCANRIRSILKQDESTEAREVKERATSIADWCENPSELTIVTPD